jgi:agmatine/peptidylarginine deiminase
MFSQASKLFIASIVLSSLASAAGLVPETQPTQAIVLSNADNFAPLLKMHQKIIESLPKDIKIIYSSQMNPKIAKNSQLLYYAQDSNWMRDFFPETVANSDGTNQLAAFTYGTQKYPQSAYFGKHMLKELNNKGLLSALKIEGGNLLVDEAENLFTTQRVMQANSQLTQVQIEAELKRMLKVKTVTILPALPFESTGHIDIFMKYMGQNIMLIADSKNPEQALVLKQVSEQMQKRGYKVVRLVNGNLDATKTSLVLTYINSLIVNKLVLIPSYASKDYYTKAAELKQMMESDEKAKKLYESLGYKVIQIPSREMIDYGGSIHCLTKEIHSLKGLNF